MLVLRTFFWYDFSMLQVLEPQGQDLGFELIGLRAAIDQLELRFARLTAQFAKTPYAAEDAGVSALEWIRFNCHMTSATVLNSVAVGEHLEQLEQSVAAMDEGEIGFAHLAVMARTAQAVGKGFAETALLPLARQHSAGKFHFKSRHYLHALDAQGYNREQEELAEGRSLRMSMAQDGCLLLSGVLDPVGGAAVRSALEPLARASGAHDERRREQRLADALVELASGGRPASLQVTATIETLKGLAGAGAAEMEFGLPLASSSVQRLACECSVTRVLLSQESLVVDVGRSRRVVSPALQKALRVRDGHCRWPGCEREASRCDGHHLVHWIQGGQTNLDNLVLLCARHHRLVHEGGWQLVRSADQLLAVAPTVTFALPRRPD
jgi:Domain of unknown function (DUF222)/HNH endonuclease